MFHLMRMKSEVIMKVIIIQSEGDGDINVPHVMAILLFVVHFTQNTN